MTTVRKVIGRLPVLIGDWDSNYREGQGYMKNNRVLIFNSECQSKIDNNTYPPATQNLQTGVITFDTTHWVVVSDGRNTIGLAEHIQDTSNPHGVTKSQVGLGNVVNTGDSDTPVSGGTTKFTTGGAYTELAKKADKTEVYTKTEGQALETSVNSAITTQQAKIDALDSHEIIVGTLPSTGVAGKVYRVPDDPAAGQYTDYGYNTGALSTPVKIATYQMPGIDNEPTAGSDNLVKSGGVANSIFQLQKEQVHLNGETFDGVVKEDKTDGASIDRNGSVEPSYTHCYFYINIKNANEVAVTFTGSDAYIVNVCNVNKQFIRNVVNWAESSIVISGIQTGECYLCVCCKIYEINDISFSITYKNLPQQIDLNSAFVDQSHAALFGGTMTEQLKLEDTQSGNYNEFGDYQDYAPYRFKNINIAGVSQITISGTGVASESLLVNLFDKDFNFIKNSAAWVSSPIVITNIPQEAYYVNINMRITDVNKISVALEYDGMAEGEMVINDLFGGNEKECLGASQGKVLSDYGLKYDSAFARTCIPNPKFIKGVFLDAGRKYFNPTNIQTIIDEAYAAGLNSYVHYFSDNGFRFGLDDMIVYANGRTYDASVCLGDSPAGGGDGTDKWLTQTEMDSLIAYANSKGIEFIPAFDMPGHTGAIGSTMNISPASPEGANFYLALLEKYVIYFQSKGCRYFNICGDESQLSMSIYAPFMNRALRIITNHNMMPLIYNDEICKDGYADPFMNTGALVLGWTAHSGLAPYSTIRKSGYNMVNANDSIYYWVLGHTTTTETLINNIRNSDIFTMADGNRDTSIKGCIYNIWCDDADADGADEGDNVVVQTAPCIAAFGEAVERCLPSNAIVARTSENVAYKLVIGDGGTLTASLL